MAVVSVNPVSDGESLKTSEGRSYRRVWRVITDSAADTPRTARFAAGIPDIGDGHPDDGGVTVTDVNAHYEKGGTEGARKLYLVEVTYQTPTKDTPSEDPLDDPVQLAWSHTAYTEVVWKDRNGAPIANSAKQRFNPGLTRTRHYSTCTIVRNEATFVATEARDYIDRVNSDIFELDGYTIGPRKCMCLDYSAQRMVRNEIEYWQVRYEFVLNGDTWDAAPLDAGLNEWKDSADHSLGLKPVEIDGKTVTEPWPLNGSGVALDADDVLTGAVFGAFQINAQAVFSNLDVGSV